MKLDTRSPLRLASFLLCALLSFLPVAGGASAAPRLLEQPELESVLAPIALYPDSVVAEVMAAAADPARLAALPYDELRERMMESPGWTRDLGYAYLWQQSDVWRAVHALRMRAGSLGQQIVVVHHVAPRVYYVPYYDPLVVYGPLWRPHRPVHWRPWHPRPPIVVTRNFGRTANPNGPPSPAAQLQQGHLPSPAAQMQQGNRPSVAARMQQQQWEKRQGVVQEKHDGKEERRHRHHR